MHSCDNRTCELLNPSLNELLEFQDLFSRVSLVEEWFYDSLEFPNPDSIPLDLFGWATEHGVYQLPNLEFVRELAKIIKDKDPEIILEVGAGRGIISRHISKIINKDIILTDDYSWWSDYSKKRSETEKFEKKKIGYSDIIKMGYNDAIKLYKPDMIIASWIPYKKFWTKEFRECPSLKGYILIGEPQGGCTGSEDDWTTNWKSYDLNSVENYGICRTDHTFKNESIRYSHTSVTYFEK